MELIKGGGEERGAQAWVGWGAVGWMEWREAEIGEFHALGLYAT